MALTNAERRKIDNMSPEMKGTSLGSEVGGVQDEIGYGVDISGVDVSIPILITAEVTADATLGQNIFNANCPFPIKIIDVIVEARATVGGGTLTLSDGSNNITDAIACAVDTTKTLAGTIDDAYSTIARGGSLVVTAANAGDRGLVTIIARRDN